MTEEQSRYNIVGGLLLGILGRGVPPGFPNPDRISDQKVSVLHPFLDLASKKLSLSLLSFKRFSNSHISFFFLTYLELK